ncbi:hypothetical protein [Planktothrix agardhii]|jgi:hypothetical protein|uniref:hypothetical protein n=1 Tax=Planktothrix agardhii TaxID=1160 RepID=UPI001D0A4F63|nr:hypothetical protein [Planktothrix agardhii]MCB8785452.1 hypothetical protein [Planktothrix agardhii 1025]MCF3612828.1 hypothetical protein [Planktothrix agardhii 1027]MCP9296754.1 hypothetical protein [Planktothrix agardhii LY1]CAD5942374.1 hypothetical protein NO2A_02456 [Planktothrix agardhii]
MQIDENLKKSQALLNQYRESLGRSRLLLQKHYLRQIWDDLNQIHLSQSSIINDNYSTNLNPEDVEACLIMSADYRVINLENPNNTERKYLEEMGVSIFHLEQLATDDFALEQTYINSFSDAPTDLLGKRINLTPVSYQQSLVETGYFYSLSPFTGKTIRSNQSFVINHRKPHKNKSGIELQGFFYRFVDQEVQEVFYIMTGAHYGSRYLVYFPKNETIINLNLIQLLKPVESINKLKSYMVICCKDVKSYIATTKKKQVVDVIGLGFNLGHYLWQDLSGLHVLYKNGILDKLDKILVGPGDYFRTQDVFPEIPPEKFVEVEDVWQVFQTAMANNYVALRVNGIFIEEELTQRVIYAARKNCSDQFLREVETAKQKCFPLLGIQIRARNSRRSWLSQVEATANLINQLYVDFPDLGIVFDGWSVTGKEDTSDICWSMINDEKSVVSDIVALISDGIPVYSAIGATTYETTTWWYQAIDLYTASIGSGLTYSSWLANKPGVVHGNALTYSYADQICSSSCRENLLPQVLVPQEYIRDVPDNSYDTDWENTNYYCDWKVIYDELIKLLNTIKKRR